MVVISSSSRMVGVPPPKYKDRNVYPNAAVIRISSRKFTK